MREVWLKYDEVRLYITTSQSRGEGQGDTQTDSGTDRLIYQIVHAGRPTGIDTTHPIILGFIPIRIQS